MLRLPSIIKGVMTRSRVDAPSELCSLFLKGRSEDRISVTRITTARMAQLERELDLVTKT